MLLDINTLKSQWFKFALIATVTWDILFFSFLWIYFWASHAGFLTAALVFVPNIIVIGTIVLVGISILMRPPIPRPWYVTMGIYLSFLAGINAGIIAFFWNDGQLPYLPLYFVFTTIGLLALNGYLLQFVASRSTKKTVETPINGPPQVIETAPAKTAGASVSKRKLAAVILGVVLLQIAVCYLAYRFIAKPQNKNLREYARFAYECIEQDKYPFLHTYQNGQEIITRENLLHSTSSIKRKDSTFHCYNTLDEALDEFPNFNDILYITTKKHVPPSEADIAHDKMKLEAEKIVRWGPIGRKRLRILWIDKLADGLKLERVILGYSDNPEVNVLPWKAEYSSKKGDGVIGYWCGESDNPLLKPDGFDSAKWQAAMKQLDGDLPERAQHSAAYSTKENKNLWIITYHSAYVMEEARNTRCVLYDAHGLLTKNEGDAMLESFGVLEYPIEAEDGEIIIDRQ